MSELNLEVWKPDPAIPTPGDYVSRFNRYYLCINPNVAQGPPTWRASDPDEFPCGDGIIIPPPPDTAEFLLISAIPLVVDGTPSAVEISLDISLAPEIDAPSERILASVEGFDIPPLLTSVSGNPVTVLYDVNDHASVLTFAFGGLEDVPESIRQNLNVTLQDYNSRGTTQSFTSIDPIELTDRDGLTEVTLDINSLPPAP